MATITFTLSAAHLTRAIDAAVNGFDYAANKLEGETQAQFAQRMYATILRSKVLDLERAIAHRAVAEPADITIT